MTRSLNTPMDMMVELKMRGAARRWPRRRVLPLAARPLLRLVLGPRVARLLALEVKEPRQVVCEETRIPRRLERPRHGS